MSTQPSNSQKQPASIYTVLLVLAMVFMLIAVIAMYVEYKRWGPDYWDTSSARPQARVIDNGPHFG